jgi:ABC-type iron transport system FetAB permease component
MNTTEYNLKLENKKFHRKIRNLVAGSTACIALFILGFFPESISVESCLTALASPILMTLIYWLIYRSIWKEEIMRFTFKSFLANMIGYGMGIGIAALTFYFFK